MLRRYLLLFVTTLFCWNAYAEEDVEWTKNLKKQVAVLEPHLLDSYYYKEIPEGKFLEFLNLYRQRPIETNYFGMGSSGNFYLWYLIKQAKPTLVVESGVWRGQSTWVIEQAAPDAKIISIDPHLNARFYFSNRAKYLTQDFSLLDLQDQKDERILCFFDDHQNAYERVVQAYKKGVKYLIFDDNYPIGYDDNLSNPHLTLRNIFESKVHSAKANLLKMIVKKYCIMPQIIAKPVCFTDGRCIQQVPAIWQSLNELPVEMRDSMRPFYNDATGYRWTTFVELH
jgi:hypothetical protein